MKEIIDLERVRTNNNKQIAWPCIHVTNSYKNTCEHCRKLILRGIECNHINIPFIKSNKTKWFKKYDTQIKIRKWLV